MLSKNIQIQPIILAGGSGTRLWPLSRESFPKQYIELSNKSKYSFLQKTLIRIQGLKNTEPPIIICNEEQRFIVAEQMREINTKPKAIILEPFGRNTAPAIAIASLKANENDKNPILLVLSSDHEIKKSDEFIKAIEVGILDAQENNLVTFGCKPTRPETGYGYIETVEKVDHSFHESYPIKRFIEKPDIKIAQDFLKDSHYLWNSGIFLFKAKAILEELNRYHPELIELCKQAFQKSILDYDFLRIESNTFKKCPNLSIDVAVMEKTNIAKVIPLKAAWSDIGNWKALWEMQEKDENGNVLIGDIKMKDVKNCYLNSQKKLLVSIGIEDLIIVQTNDATLVAKSKDSQKVKDIVNELNSEGRFEGKLHTKIFRPWGFYKSIKKGDNWQVKEITVNPKSSLSLQKHNFRSEHWIILQGKAMIEINNSKFLLNVNQSTYIPIGSKHRLSNNEDFPLVLIEVQCGSYLGEDDIYRYKDNYGR